MNTTAALSILAGLFCSGGIGYLLGTRWLRADREAARAEGRGEGSTEIARLLERCSQRESTIRANAAQLQDVEAQLQQASSRAAELERENAKLQQQAAEHVKLESVHAELVEAYSALNEQLSRQRELTARHESAAGSSDELRSQLQARVSALTALEDSLRAALNGRERELSEACQHGVRLQSELNGANSALAEQRAATQDLDQTLTNLQGEISRLSNEGTRLQATLDAERIAATSLTADRETLLAQFKALSAEVLEEKGRALTDHNASALNQLLAPMKEQFTACTNEFKEVNRVAGQERAALGEQFKAAVQQTQAAGIQTENLTKALKGDQKTQGIFGEMILENLLELAGLVEGTHFDCQQSFTGEDEKRAVPDVVLRLPGERHLVIDSKMSLTAYERAISSVDHDDRNDCLKQHVNSVRSHIRALAQKNYQEIYQLKSLDFVLLFVPMESAFAAAVSNDNQLFRDAWEKNVIVVSPSTLLFVVRTVAFLWRQETQVQNVKAIAKRGAALYDKLCGFVSDLEEVGRYLGKSRTAYESAFKKLRTGEGNVIRQAEILRELGVKPTKKLSVSLLADDTSEDAPVEDLVPAVLASVKDEAEAQPAA